MNALISSALHTVVRGPSFTGLGKRPSRQPCHHALLLMGKSSMICGSRRKPVEGICVAIKVTPLLMVDERSYYNKFLQLKQEPCSVRYGTIEYDGVRLFCNWLYELRKIFAKKVTENERFLANIVKLQHIKISANVVLPQGITKRADAVHPHSTLYERGRFHPQKIGVCFGGFWWELF